MTLDEVRGKYLEYFESKGHAIIPSASLVPENDPTTLFTGSGMQPLLPFLLGEPHPRGKRLADSQKCFRSQDIEEVGDNRHTTFFEMLGNWSLGDYFKAEQLSWFFEFLVKEVGLSPKKLYVTCFIGDSKNSIPKDTESAAIWKKLFAEQGIDAREADMGSEEEGYGRGMKDGERIFFYDAKKNWWSRSGVPENMPAGEPGGPDSEVFYNFETPHDEKFGAHCHPNCDCGRFLEIGNSVFMEYLKNADGTFSKLPQRNVDFGGGLERIVAAANNDPDVFHIDVLRALIQKIESYSSTYRYDDVHSATTHFPSSEVIQRAFRIVADHIRGAVFMMGDNIKPSNKDQGYALRRILRRAIYYAKMILDVKTEELPSLAIPIIELYQKSYPALKDKEIEILQAISLEERKFSESLSKGISIFNKIAEKANKITAQDTFILFSTYGFPLEMTLELAAERGIEVDVEGFKKEMTKHQEVSRAGSEQKFKGGLADHSEMSVKYHTATHLLHQALREVLGPEVLQKGSNITPERLRFDFAFPRKMTDEEKKRVEDLVNEQIKAALPVSFEDIPLEEAKKRGAVGLFGEKYGDVVRVYRVGDFSLEFCGGPHVTNTSVLGHFSIAKEEAISAGVRRIKATLS